MVEKKKNNNRPYYIFQPGSSKYFFRKFSKKFGIFTLEG